MPATPTTDHIRQALGKLISRFQGRPRFAALVACNVNQTQLLEDAIWGVIDSRDVDTCDETRLKLLAKIVGQPIVGTVEQLRTYVKVRVLVNRSRGRAPELLKIARILLGSVAYFEGSAHMIIEALEALGGRDPNTAAALLRDAKTGGVGLTVVYSPASQDDSFVYSSALGDVPGDGLGSSTDASTGGVIAAIA